MTREDFFETLTAEQYMTCLGRLMWFGELPDKNKYLDVLDKDFVVASENMKNDSDVKYALMLSQEVNMYIDISKLDENSIEYDDLAFFCELQFANIMTHWFGVRRYNQEKSWVLECIRDNFWDFMRGDIDFDELKKNVTDYNSKYIR